jgi:hypothetical protein
LWTTWVGVGITLPHAFPVATYNSWVFRSSPCFVTLEKLPWGTIRNLQGERGRGWGEGGVRWVSSLPLRPYPHLRLDKQSTRTLKTCTPFDCKPPPTAEQGSPGRHSLGSSQPEGGQGWEHQACSVHWHGRGGGSPHRGVALAHPLTGCPFTQPRRRPLMVP